MADNLQKKIRTDDVKIQEDSMDFSTFLLKEPILRGLQQAGYITPSPIQLEAIPYCKLGEDVMIQAKSGTGKSLVFVITALEMLQADMFYPQVVIIAPTREIASQICDTVKLIGEYFPRLTCHAFIGGTSTLRNIKVAGKCQIVVGTPGRIKRLVLDRYLPMDSVRLFILDEADQLLKPTLKEDVVEIYEMVPEDCQVITASTICPPEKQDILVLYMNQPKIICSDAKNVALLGVHHYVKIVEYSNVESIQYKIKVKALEEILASIEFTQCLIYCGRNQVEYLYKDIKKLGYSASFISGASDQFDRLRAIDELKSFKCKICVSSDLTSHGIDAEHVDLVIGFELGIRTDNYMNRAGRAGRYGSYGVYISIIREKDFGVIHKLEMAVDFKTHILPDPIPKDLIQEKSFGKYLIDENDPIFTYEIKEIKDIEVKESSAEDKNCENEEQSRVEFNASLNGKVRRSGKNAVVYDYVSTTSEENYSTTSDSSSFASESDTFDEKAMISLGYEPVETDDDKEEDTVLGKKFLMGNANVIYDKKQKYWLNKNGFQFRAGKSFDAMHHYAHSSYDKSSAVHANHPKDLSNRQSFVDKKEEKEKLKKKNRCQSVRAGHHNVAHSFSHVSSAHHANHAKDLSNRQSVVDENEEKFKKKNRCQSVRAGHHNVAHSSAHDHRSKYYLSNMQSSENKEKAKKETGAQSIARMKYNVDHSRCDKSQNYHGKATSATYNHHSQHSCCKTQSYCGYTHYQGISCRNMKSSVLCQHGCDQSRSSYGCNFSHGGFLHRSES